MARTKLTIADALARIEELEEENELLQSELDDASGQLDAIAGIIAPDEDSDESDDGEEFEDEE